jgi:hypothetical protein
MPFIFESKYMRLFLLSIFSVFGLPLCAQEMLFITQANSNEIGINNVLEVSFSVVNGTGIQKFQRPSFANFDIVGGPLQSSYFSNINGKSANTIRFTYFVKPTKLGQLSIQGATAIMDGKTIRSNDITVKIVKANTASKARSKGQLDPANDPLFNTNPNNNIGQTPLSKSAPNARTNKPTLNQDDIAKKIFARVDVDKKEAYLGEQITASYNVYSQVNIEAGIRKPSSPQGFWTQDLSDNLNPMECERVVENGKEYKKYTLRKSALFATQPGTLQIPPIEIEGAVEYGTEETSLIGGLLSLLTEGNEGQIPFKIQTKTVEVTAKQLPTTTLNTNNISIGNYTLESNIDKAEITTDDVVTMKIIVRGNGNIKLIQAPTIQIPGDFETIQPKATDTITSTLVALSGYKTFSYTLSPRNAGTLFIPPATFTYFNPSTGQYEQAATIGYTIKVLPGKKKVSNNKALPQDIHDIRNSKEVITADNVYLPERALYWLLYLIPLCLLIASSWYKNKYTSSYKSANKQKDASHIAQQRLSIATEMLKEHNANGFYNETAKAMWLYLSDKLGIPMSKLNKNSIIQQLAEQGINQTMQADIQYLLDTCDACLYGASQQQNRDELYKKAITIITELENKIS